MPNKENIQEAVDILTTGSGGTVVSPTKVGYIIMTSDNKGLKRKFAAKKRKLNKPGVVLCSSMEQLRILAQMTPEIEAFYQANWDKDILLGCILPWNEDGLQYIPDDGSNTLMMDERKTSCFVIKFGTISEQICKELWDNNEKLVFASSANPSGKGNGGLASGIGKRIQSHADIIIEDDTYVKSIQPNSTEETRYEQGVMVSMVDNNGKLIPEQKKERAIEPCPTVIRKGLDIEKIVSLLSEHFPSWDMRQGTYY
jgi:tRNA A37 threonylcarbamoyladenosine synthetase subunit TsaC/SUA5/YrdC